MAAESIGDLIPTAIPGYADAADIQAALRVYHYGSYAYNPANTSPGSLVSPSMAKTIYDIQQDIVDLENRPSSGGDVSNTAPVPGDFTPSGIPNGYIWVDQDGTIGGQPISATSVFTNTVPTSDLSTGVIWVDKDPTSITANPFIPTAVINAKGDLIAGSADDSAVRVAVASTNGYVLNVNSSTTSGLDWVDSAASTQTFTNKTINLTSNTLSGTIAQFNTALSDADFATVAGTETLTGKTISGTSNTITNIAITSAVSGLGTNVATFLATPSSANLASAITDETGTGALVFSSSPSLTTPNLGTPSAVTLTNATGLPVTSGISGLGSNVATFLATPSSANLASAVSDETGSGSLVFGTSPTIASATLTSPVVTGTLDIQQVLEKVTVSATAATGTINYELLDNGAVTFYTSNASGNWTLNVRGSSTTSLNTVMETGESMTLAFLVTNGATPYRQTALNIDGSAVTPKWQGGTAPSAGNANSVDIYTLTVIKTANATFSAFEAQTQFA